MMKRAGMTDFSSGRSWSRTHRKSTASSVLGRVAPTRLDDIIPLFNGLARAPDRLGKRLFFFVIGAPLSAVVHLDEMRQSPAGREQLPLGIATLDFDSQSFGH